MFTRHNTTLVVQGPVYPQWTVDFLKDYNQHFDHVIFSTWSDESIESNEFQIIKSDKPDIAGPGNVNYQLKSSLIGCNAVTTPYIFKVRSDMLIVDSDKWLEFFSSHWQQDRIFTLGLSRFFPFYTRDHIWAGTKEDLINLFSIDYIPKNYTPCFTNMYPELYIASAYYARHSQKVQTFLTDPKLYLIGNYAPNGSWQQPKYFDLAMEEWHQIGEKYFYPVSKNLKYLWYKYFPETGEYWYDFASRSTGEYWHEDILNRQRG